MLTYNFMHLVSGGWRQSSISHYLHKAQTFQEQICIFQTWVSWVLIVVSLSDKQEDVSNLLGATKMFADGFTFKRATNTSVLLERAACLGFENTVVLFQHTFFFQQCVKGCLWHFTLVSLKRRVKPYSFVKRQVNTWTWRSPSFQAVLKFLIPRDLFIRGVMV